MKKKRIDNLPTKVYVGFREYLIREAPKKERKERRYNGACLSEENEIRLRTDVGEDEVKASFFHEYFHAVLADDALTPMLELKDTEEEGLCQLFSSAIMQLLRNPDNWKIIEWAHSKEEPKPSDTEIK